MRELNKNKQKNEQEENDKKAKEKLSKPKKEKRFNFFFKKKNLSTQIIKVRKAYNGKKFLEKIRKTIKGS